MNGVLWVTEYWTATWGWVWVSGACASTRMNARIRRKKFMDENQAWQPKTRVVKYGRSA